jgi:peptide chain release factor 1
MFDKLNEIMEKYDRLSQEISDPAVMGNRALWTEKMKEHSALEPLVTAWQHHEKLRAELDDTVMMLSESQDEAFTEMLIEERDRLKAEIEQSERDIRVLMLPKDPNDERNVVVEIRGGAGGEEAALFAADLYRMYTRYAERRRWKSEVLGANYTDIGGIKEISFVIEGKGAYSRLKYESGVHRVQRIPTTESGGRIHTSTATVAVLPEAEEVDVQIDPGDLRVDVYRSSGHGGQSVNTTDSAVRITHLPTGIVVTCQDEKSQLKNREKAMRVLRARLLEQKQEEQAAQYAQARRSQVGTGDRSERIRTYNFPQGRITDHRIGYTLHQLEAFLDGEIDEMIEALIAEDQDRQLKTMAQ